MQDIETVVRNFHKAGLGRKVAVFSLNSLSYVLAVLACWKTGRTVIPLNIHEPQERISQVLEQAGCADVLAGPGPSARFPAGLHVCGIEEMTGRVQTRALRLLPWDLGPVMDKDASILFTSGSTGRPKAVLHSVSNHYHSALGANRNMPLQEGSVYVAALPFCHIGGLSILMRVLLSGTGIAIKVPGSSISETVKEACGTHLSLVPSQLEELLRDPQDIKVLRKMQAVLIGGSALSDSLVEACHDERLKIIRTYGLSEMSSQVTATSSDDSLDHLKTSGRVLPYREVRIGEDQEILVRGPTLFRGYLHEGRICPARKDGWFATKDTGFFDPEDHLHVTGRLDNMFQVQGINVHPEEVERQLESMEGVLSCLVVAVEGPKGMEAAAFVKTLGPIDARKMQAFLAGKLSRQKVPRHYLPWPKTKGLKPDRKGLARAAQEALGFKGPNIPQKGPF